MTNSLRKNTYLFPSKLKTFSFAESEVLEAHAQYDFTARSSREVSFRKGDTILLYAQVTHIFKILKFI